MFMKNKMQLKLEKKHSVNCLLFQASNGRREMISHGLLFVWMKWSLPVVFRIGLSDVQLQILGRWKANQILGPILQNSLRP
jgi:hypothetical protein